MKSIKKIDIHCHITAFPDYLPPWPDNQMRYLNIEEQLDYHDKLNVELGGILPIVSPENHWMHISNQEAIQISRENPDKYFWYCNVDPRQAEHGPNADLEYIIQFYKSLGAKGVGEIMSQLYADDPMMDNLFGACERQNMPVLIHMAPKFYGTYGIVDDAGLPRLERMLQKHPDLKIIGHSACFWCEISNDCPEELRNAYPTGKITEGRLAKLLRTYPNLYCDISAGSGHGALMRDPAYTAKFIDEFSDRIMYGIDVCRTTFAKPFAFDNYFTKLVEDGLVSEENYRRIVRSNAIQMFHLDLDPS